MENFIFQNPVKLIMGKGMIARLAKEIPSDKRIMITFGGGSVKKNGVYDQVKEALKNHFTVEFWGIEPNPAIETLRKAIALGKEEKVDYLLAVGGGSVIDGTKLISAGILFSNVISSISNPELNIDVEKPLWDMMKPIAVGKSPYKFLSRCPVKNPIFGT